MLPGPAASVTARCSSSRSKRRSGSEPARTATAQSDIEEDRMTRRLGVMLIAVLFGVAFNAPVYAQAPKPEETKPAEAKPEEKKEEKPKTLWEEHTLFAYIENSAVWNTGRASRGNHNELRLYDFEGGYTFNVAEFSIKKDPTEQYLFGYGLVLTAGVPGTSNDSQKNHALGIFRGDNDQFPFRNTPNFDLQEAYGSYQFPLGSGLTLKAGKFVTLLGYEVIESPNDLNFSRGFLFTFAIPLTHVGALLSYSPLPWLSLTAGPVVGWDVARDNNSRMSVMGQVGYVAYDWTEQLRTALRLEYFQDSDGIRTLAVAPGSRVELYEVTATVQYKIWKGLVGRLEYRHDSADEKVFAIRAPGYVPTGKTQNTLTLALYYSFF